jgi:thiol-disulfide isomerase/thioredoxin
MRVRRLPLVVQALRLLPLLILILPLPLLPGCSPAAPPDSVPARHIAAPTPAPAASPAPAADEKDKDKPPAQPAKPDALVEQAEQAARRGELETATKLLDQAIAAEPGHRNALVLLALYSEERAGELERPASSVYYFKAGQAVRALQRTYKDLNPQERELIGPFLYNEACTYAVQNETDKALDSLAEALDAGFAQADLIAEDEELAALRSSPRFAALARKAEANAREQAGATAKKLVAETSPFPFRFELPDLNGKTVSLDDVKGKLIIVDVWGTWCPPCRKELPHLKKLLESYREKGVAIIGINYERGESADAKETVKAFVKEQGIPYTCLIGDDKTREQIPRFEGYPTTLFLDRSGTVRVKAVGYHPYVELEAIVTLLLGEGS